MSNLADALGTLAATTICLIGLGCAPEPATTPPSLPSPVVVAEQSAPEVVAAEPVEEMASAPNADAAEPTATKPAPPFYTVAAYDEQQDIAGDLAATIERATAENKRILLQIGGEWCGWCHRISDYMETNERVRQLVDEHFVVMKVTYPSDNAESFLSQYPDVNAYPHFFVLESDGTLLHSQGTGELEHEKSYDEEVFCQFLNNWTL